MRWKRGLTWLGYLLWALFVNACDVWIVRPLLLDYAAIGMVGLVVLVLLWLFSIPKAYRRRWLGFTLFSLLLGNGVSNILYNPSLGSIVLLVVMVIGLTFIAWLMARVRITRLLTGALALIIANLWLPMTLWPFLTHFEVAYHANLNLVPGDFPTVPLEVVNTPSGQEVVSLTNVQESSKNLNKAALAADNSSNALENLLRNYNHRYALVSLTQAGKGFHLQDVTPQTARSVDPLSLVTTFFPTIRAYWAVEGTKVIQYMAPAASPRVMSEAGVTPGNLVSNLITMGQQTAAAETSNWQQMLQPYGGMAEQQGLTVQNGYLRGTWNGQNVDIAVTGNRVVGVGSFTGSGQHEVLIEGPNFLSVVSLDTDKVVSTYQGNVWHPLSNDVVTGPLTASKRDVIFVNSSPAEILEPAATGNWKVLYTAPNPSLRFEASVRDTASGSPEIITDDPSLIRNSPTRYFTSYTYRDGQLVRNWRVYETNVVNVNPVQFEKNGTQYIVAAIYGTGHVLVLKRQFLPILPATSAILGIIIVLGYVRRFTWKGEEAR